MSRDRRRDPRPRKAGSYDQTQPARPPSPVVQCSVAYCGVFVDDDAGRQAHVVVMGHQPRKGDRPEA